jgi:hypothetical protein
MARHSKRGPSGRFTPADALDIGTVPDAATWQTDVSGNPEGEHDMPGVMTQYPSDFTRPKPLNGHENGRANPYIGSGCRATGRDSAGIDVPKPKQGTSSMFLSPATNAIATRAQKDARIVSSYARNPEDLGDDY